MTDTKELIRLAGFVRNLGGTVNFHYDQAIQVSEGRNVIKSVTIRYSDAPKANRPMGPIAAAERMRRIVGDVAPMSPADLEVVKANVRRISIEAIDHPEWGTWGVWENNGQWLEIGHEGGSRVLHYGEALRFWRIAPESARRLAAAEAAPLAS